MPVFQVVRAMLRLLITVCAVSSVLGIVPLPKQYTSGGGSVQLDPNLVYAASNQSCETLKIVIERINATMFSHAARGPRPLLALTTIEVSVQSCVDTAPQLGVDESYVLTVPSAGEGNATLKAVTVFGAMAGLETLSQLAHYDYDAEAVLIEGTPWHIEDAPRFAHRGMLIDVSRHFYPVSSLIALLDAMAACKLNVLHWHLSDSTSFPLVVPGTNLSKGAWKSSQRYSAHDVTKVVEAARVRGIRVEPEFDMPAHTVPAWCVGHPEICAGAANGGALDPSTEATYDVVAKVIAHASQLFPDRFFHLGGDEIKLKAWTADPKVRKYLMSKYPGTDVDEAAETEAYSAFPARVGAMAESHGKRVVHWEDVFDWAGGGTASAVCGGISPSLPNSTVVQIFRGGFAPGEPTPGKTCGSNGAVTAMQAVRAGYDVIWGPPGSWYLSCYSDVCSNSGGGSGFEPWESVFAAEPFYNADPLVEIKKPEE